MVSQSLETSLNRGIFIDIEAVPGKGIREIGYVYGDRERSASTAHERKDLLAESEGFEQSFVRRSPEISYEFRIFLVEA